MILILLCGETKAEITPPSPESIRQVISAANVEWEKFESETFECRMQFELSGRLLSERDKTFFCGLAQSARDGLDRYINQQQSMLERIETYEGADWESLYGSTGLWRHLAASLEATKLNRDQIDYLHLIICQAMQPAAAAAERLFRRKLKTDLETQLSLAILKRKYAPDEYHKLPQQEPQTAIVLGKLLLREMSAQFNAGEVNFASFSDFDVELGAIAALQANPQPYSELLLKLAENEKFQTPAVLCVSASLYSQANPSKAVEMLIKASNTQLTQPNVLLKKTPEEIARLAFETAYKQFQEDVNVRSMPYGICQPAITAFENYSRVALERIDEQTQYLYADLLNNCNRTDDAAKAFERLAKQSQSFWDDAATLELLKIDLNKNRDPNETLAGLRDFIFCCVRPEERITQLRLEAMRIYCETLLRRDSNDSAQFVLEILDAALPTPGLPYELYRAKAYEQSGRLEESIHFLSKAVGANDCSIAPDAVLLVSDVLDKIELWQQNARDFNQMLLDCVSLAEFANKCLSSRQTSIIFAEISALLRKRGLTPFPPDVENDVSHLRARARRLMAKGDYNQATRLWAKIAELRRNDLQTPNQKSYGWWQAKFYELECLSKTPQADKQNISHTIEVLQNSYADIPAPFAKKLDLLKQQCAAN